MFSQLFRRKASTPDNALGDTIFGDEHYRVTFRPGRSSTVILAFCGVGLRLGGIQTEEFRTSIGELSPTYFLADKERTWWNAGRIEFALDAIFRHAATYVPRARFVSVGNSMGGSGAILAAHIRTEVAKCLAFVPQAKIDLSITDHRWLEYRSRILEHRWQNFAELEHRADTRIVFGSGYDDLHKNEFKKNGFTVVEYVEFGHNVANKLKKYKLDEYNSLINFLL